MEIQYFGANCVRITTKKASIIIDDNLEDLGQKSVTKAGEIALFTSPHDAPKQDVKIVISQPGEYEVSDTSIHGIAARAHVDEEGTSVTMFKIVDGDIKIAVTGHVHPDLTDNQLEQIGMVDVLIVPAGGNGYTMDPVGALKLIRKIDPKIAIPTHYDESGFNFPVPQQPLEEIKKVFALEPMEITSKFKVKPSDLTDTTQLVILEK